jgi:hypothetical protein
MALDGIYDLLSPVTLENRENLEKKNQNPVFLGLAALHYSRL